MQAPTVGPDLRLQPLAKRLGVLMAASAHHSLFTDGMFEVDSPAGEQFSHELLLAAVQRRAHLAPSQLLSELLSEIRQFSASESFADDVCVIAVEVTRLC